MSGVWVEATDPKTQRKYYYNKETKKTQWSRPAEMDASDGANGGADDPEALASNWAQNTDPKTGRVYFYNRITKKTSWNKPACMQQQEEERSDSTASQSAAAAPAAAKPAEWREAKDPNSGRTYWYNKATKETTWKNPMADAGSSASVMAASPTAAPAPISASGVKGPRSAKELLAGDEDDDDEEEEDEDDDDNRGQVKPTAAVASVATKTSARNGDSEEEEEEDDDGAVASNRRGGSSVDQSASSSASSAASAAAAEEEDDGKTKNIQDMLRDENSDDEDKGDKQQADSMMKLKQARQKIDDDDEGDETAGGHEFKFAKHRHGWFARVFRTGNIFDESKLLSYKKSLIKKALLKQNRDLDDEAVQTFKNIMSYMGDRRSSKPPIEHAKKMIRNLMIAPAGLRDESYMQLIKQTTQNPSLDSCVKGWELVSFCLATFPPSKHLKTFLLDYLKKNAADNSRPKVQSLAQLCLERLPTILSMGQRKQVPSSLELQCLMDGKPIPIRVFLCNGTFKTFTIDPYTTCRELEDMLVQKYSLTLREIFALYESAGPNEERMLDARDRVVDVLASWENKPLVEEKMIDPATQKKVKTYGDKDKQVEKLKIEKKEIKFTSLLFKAKLVLKTGNKDIMSDPEAVSLIYIQATQDVVTQRYPCAEKDITVLAALQLQATYGDYKKDVHVPGWLKSKINEVMPAALLEKKGTGKQSDALVSEWEQKILAKYAKVAGFSAMEAKLNYLDYVQEWVFYGSSFFLIEQRQFKDYPSPLLMGINSEGVLLMHPEKKTVLENYHYTDIVTWGHSDEKFILVVGNIVQQRKLIFKTSDGKQMNHLIHDYVKFKVKGKAEESTAISS